MFSRLHLVNQMCRILSHLGETLPCKPPEPSNLIRVKGSPAALSDNDRLPTKRRPFLAEQVMQPKGGKTMESIREFMAEHHRACDHYFADVEQAIRKLDWTAADTAFAAYRREMEVHFETEEKSLFPQFEAKTGMTRGPTQVMRAEHAQILELIDSAAAALRARDAADYSGYAETLLIMTQQHNMKEENILYPMCDQHLIYQLDELVPQLKREIAAEEGGE